MPFLLFSALFILTCTEKLSSKKLQTTTAFDLPQILMANVVNAIVGVVYYLAIGVPLRFELKMVLFGGIYGVIGFVGLILAIIQYRHMSIPLSAIITTAAYIVGSSLFGYVILSEKVTVCRLIAAAAVMAAVVLPAVESLRGKSRMKKSDFVFCALYFVFMVAVNILSSVFAAFPDMNGREYYLHVNIYLLVVSAVFCAYLLFVKNHNFKNIVSSLNFSQSGLLCLRSGINQTMNLCVIALLAIVPVTTYNIINCSLAMLASVVVAAVFYREKLTLSQGISILLLIAATALSTM